MPTEVPRAKRHPPPKHDVHNANRFTDGGCHVAAKGSDAFVSEFVGDPNEMPIGIWHVEPKVLGEMERRNGSDVRELLQFPQRFSEDFIFKPLESAPSNYRRNITDRL